MRPHAGKGRGQTWFATSWQAPQTSWCCLRCPFVTGTFTTRTVDLAAWRAALDVHDKMMARLVELQTRVVLSSRPVDIQGKRLNQGFWWTRDGEYRGARAKYYLPNEPDGWEATWFDRGDRDFSPVTVGAVTVA